MNGRIMNTRQILEETTKLLGTIELPVIQQKAIAAIFGSIRNIQIVLRMMEDEENAERQETENGNADVKQRHGA